MTTSCGEKDPIMTTGVSAKWEASMNISYAFAIAGPLKEHMGIGSLYLLGRSQEQQALSCGTLLILEKLTDIAQGRTTK